MPSGVSKIENENNASLAVKPDGTCLFRAFRVSMASVTGLDREHVSAKSRSEKMMKHRDSESR